MDHISIVIPAYNEAQNIPSLYDEIVTACSPFALEILFVNDGSTDSTIEVIRALQFNDNRIKLISFTKNTGHQAALRAGLRNATGDYIVSIDADLQQPPGSIPQMVEYAHKGFDVITMVRDRPQRGFIKNIFSRLFYFVFTKATSVSIPDGTSDFRLITRQVQTVLNSIPERNLFFRGVLQSLGFSSTTLRYELRDRKNGQAHFTFKKSLFMAEQALFSFSTFPLRFFFFTGIFVSIGAFGYGIFNIICRIFTDWNIPGYTDIIASILFLGGLNLVILAIFGKYIQIIIDHIKQRPEYLIDQHNSDPIINHNC